MPIKPENRAKYPKDWDAISWRIRFERAEGKCEFCQEAEHGKPHPVTGGMVVLTVAHLNHDPGEVGPLGPGDSDDQLAAMCQRCHNTYDQPYRRGRIINGKYIDPNPPGPLLKRMAG
ncbi:MAG: hypothetical protein OXT06_14640 [Rhodospirillaceae bacterium]|nr:hypothetical protein [Rhodospirillaceae bacterium]